MRLSELYTRPLKEVLGEMELLDMKVHTDDDGNIKVVELKYVENKKNDMKPRRNSELIF